MIKPQKAVHFRSILKLLENTSKIKYDIKFNKNTQFRVYKILDCAFTFGLFITTIFELHFYGPLVEV